MDWLITIFTGLLSSISEITGDWGLAIVILTLAIKLLFFPLRVKGARFQQVGVLVADKRKLLQEKYRNDQQRLAAEIAKVYQEHKYFPLQSIMRILFQAPVMMGLYFSLSQGLMTMDSWLLPWVESLGLPDPSRLLPLISGAVAGLVQKLSSINSFGGEQLPALQTTIMALVITMVTIFFLWQAPAGVALYWTTSNLAALAENRFIMRLQPRRTIEKEEKGSLT